MIWIDLLTRAISSGFRRNCGRTYKTKAFFFKSHLEVESGIYSKEMEKMDDW